ncbi:hypothetical protein AMJ52_04220 [candidate division TA06 bacterium DG_78]|uniref:FlgD Ig-like domain-containing protein n=1 Tax=candidate division TA06 bacterium DG_78 TaxID=1703772 RepID=A0A0S7YF66_UNCT6|nr:MAG: hypothetical protein AMJ52_04220 [candidate division TA06 bacterium DG_78]
MVEFVTRNSLFVNRNTKNESRIQHLIFLPLTFLFLFLSFSFAQDGGIPGAFLNYGVTPRTIAMGKTFTGLADDQEAVYYNPAGITQLLTHNIKASRLMLYGADINYLGYALPTKKWGALSLGIINYGSGNIDSRDTLSFEYPSFGVTQNCFIFTYAYQPFRLFSLGANFKLVTSKIAQYGAVGMGSDLGLFMFPCGDLTFGLACQNIGGPRLTHYEETETFPITFRGGGAVKLYQGKLIIAVDIVKNILEYTPIEPHLGIEFILLYPYLVLRGGFDRNFINMGVGMKKDLNTSSFGFDYSIELHHGSSYLLPPRHKIGVFVHFGGFRTWVVATPKQFSPTPGRKENVAWLDLHYNTKRDVDRWQLLIKNQYGEIVRTYAGWEAPPLRLAWDGLDDVGRVVTDGNYYYEIIIIDVYGETISYSDLLTRVTTLGPEGKIEFLPQD